MMTPKIQTLEAGFTDPEATHASILPTICAGRVTPGRANPAGRVTVSSGGIPVLHVDIHADEPDCYAFKEAIFWHSLLIIGFGSCVYAISMEDHMVVTISLDEYFGHFYPRDGFVLIASGVRLLRLQPDRSIRWASDVLGIDGVIVNEVSATMIHGEGEWDPPGGWMPFTLSVEDGKPLR